MQDESINKIGDTVEGGGAGFNNGVIIIVNNNVYIARYIFFII